MGEPIEFQDWEVLHNPEAGFVTSSETVENLREFEGVEADSEGIIRSDYFSLDSRKVYARTHTDGNGSEGGSVESNNPSWIDPGPEIRFERKNSSEFWSDSSFDHADPRKSSDVVNGEEIGENDPKNEKLGSFWSAYGGDESASTKLGDGENGSEVGFGDATELSGESDGGNESTVKYEGGHEKHSDDDKHTGIEAERLNDAEGEKRKVVWWKVPLEVLKFCVFRVSPIWSLSVAAAMLGFVILSRRLYKMKRKSRSLQLKVTVDDKKVSQIMSHAARLNEAFSVVRRVPIIRPSLPAAGATPWPMMSLR